MIGRNIKGIIYPLPKNLTEDILLKDKNIFYKYIGTIPTKKTKIYLTEGMNLFIYESGGTRKIVGLANIKKIFYETAQEIIEKYSNKMMGDIAHLKKYSKGRENKKLQVLLLENIKQLKPPIIYENHMSISGRYMDSEYFDIHFKKESE